MKSITSEEVALLHQILQPYHAVSSACVDKQSYSLFLFLCHFELTLMLPIWYPCDPNFILT